MWQQILIVNLHTQMEALTVNQLYWWRKSGFVAWTAIPLGKELDDGVINAWRWFWLDLLKDHTHCAWQNAPVFSHISCEEVLSTAHTLPSTERRISAQCIHFLGTSQVASECIPDSHVTIIPVFVCGCGVICVCLEIGDKEEENWRKVSVEISAAHWAILLPMAVVIIVVNYW